MLLETDHGILQHGEHQHSLGIEMKTPSLSRLKLRVDKNIRLKNHHCLFFNHRAALRHPLNPKRRTTLLIRSLGSSSLFDDHDYLRDG
jgi:hypothetical protein